MPEQIQLKVNGESIVVPAGNMVTAAIMRANQLLHRQSVRGEPRGPLCGMGICFECRVTINGVPSPKSMLNPL